MIPENAKRIALQPLALGEKTGHHHSLYAPAGIELEDVAEMYEVEGEGGTRRVFLRITAEGVSLQHQEHKSHCVAQGEYEVRIQTEVTDWGTSQVQD